MVIRAVVNPAAARGRQGREERCLSRIIMEGSWEGLRGEEYKGSESGGRVEGEGPGGDGGWMGQCGRVRKRVVV